MRWLPINCVFVSLLWVSVIFTWDLAGYPPYFFCDEAIHGLDAASLIETGNDIHGRRWPVLFQGLGDYALSLTVYAQIPFIWFMGLNEEAVRLRSVFFSLLGMSAVAWFFWSTKRKQTTWLVFAFFGISPFWYLHSRSGFEYVTATAFYLASASAYVLAISGRPRLMYLAAFSAVAAFYSYTPARGWVVASFILLAILNWRQHVRYRSHTFFALLLSLLLFIPYLSFQLAHPDYANKRLMAVGFGSFLGKSTFEQISQISEGYWQTLDPLFWFSLSGTLASSGQRHIIPGLSAIPEWMLPFFIVGFVALLMRFYSLQNRSLLAILMAVPLPSAMVEINHERTIAVGALYVVISLFGADLLWRKVSSKVPALFLQIGLIILLAWNSINFHRYVHKEAVGMYSDYGFYGTQSGASQLFRWIEKNQDHFSDISIAQGTFNAATQVASFFLPKELANRVKHPFLSDLCRGKLRLVGRQLWVAQYSVMEELRASECPLEIEIQAILNDVRGAPLHSIFTLKAKDNYEQWISNKVHEQQQKRNILQETIVLLPNQESLKVRHHPIATGQLQNLFNGTVGEVVRIDEVNPAIFEVEFTPRKLSEVHVIVSHTTKAEIELSILKDGTWVELQSKQFNQSAGDSPTISFTFSNPTVEINGFRIKMTLTDWGSEGSPHLSRIWFN